MADLKTTQLTALAATPANTDQLMIVDVSDTTMAASGTNKKISAVYFVATDGNNTLVTGGGTVSLGGRTLTVPAAGTAAIRSEANTFTRVQTISNSGTTDHGLVINMPSGVSASARTIRALVDNTLRGALQLDSANGYFSLSAYDNGASEGTYVTLGRNSNASTPAAGFVAMTDKGGQTYRVWPDDSGVLRIHTSDPTNGNDTAGNVVGAQTSNLAAKTVLGSALPAVEIYEHIATGAAAVKRFEYKSGAFNAEEFSGVVVDYAPRYGMDRDEAHPAGRSLNVVTAIGDLMIAVADLAARVAALEAQ